MREVGVRELKARASEIVRDVRDHRARYTVTYRGRPVGMLVPMPAPGLEDMDETISWSELSRLGEAISEGWCSPLTSTEILSEMRR
ncbi:MAG TPA: type II toxin-antitoxin system Phd/YefM family antitoxin [Chloroflexota bacterium]|nr:type II toxin-antitoxin system Phd/YefM family antitoxin [Chloroflexota bacterium]